MASAPAPQPVSRRTTGPERPAKRDALTQSTAHLKQVPPTRSLREQLRTLCGQTADRLDKSLPLSKDEIELLARGVLEETSQPEAYVGWTMVMLASAFWRDQVAATPPDRRLLLLPHCLRHAEGCPADYDQKGLDCQRCGACGISDFVHQAERLGYKVLVAEGSPIVMKTIVSGQVDALVGVACLNVLERTLDKILLAGIPCMAVPLIADGCRDTSVDEDWVGEMIHARTFAPTPATQTYLHLMRGAAALFETKEFERLAPPLRAGPRPAHLDAKALAELDPVAATEALAYDFLARGGKYARPFITLAVYDALTGGHGANRDGRENVANFPDAVKRAAMSIEVFHKASLVHDDLEDNDAYRYGDTTIHREFGAPTAVNVGDFLIGMGYRLISREAASLGANVVTDILCCLSEAHTKLCEGQGAELLWRDARDKRLQPMDALRIYSLKTAPAFEAAVYTGIRLAGPADGYLTQVRQFTRNVGIAFQILNDLDDWRGDRSNKRNAGGDILGGRPTLLWALALEALSPAGQRELLRLAGAETNPPDARLDHVRRLYMDAGAFDKAHRLIEKQRQRAEETADQVAPRELSRLFRYLVDCLLSRTVDKHEPPTPNHQ